MPLQPKSTDKFCEICETTEEENFTPCVYNICKSCKKIKNAKPYLCKYCGDSDKENFPSNRYSTCKKCRNSKEVTERIKNKVYNEVSTPTSETSVPTQMRLNLQEEFKKFVLLDYSLFDGFTLKQVIDNFQKEILTLSQKVNILEEENSKLKYQHFKTSFELNELKM